MYILGIYSGHNATAALLKDGEIIACVSEERFNGKKNYLGFPKESIVWCLKFAKISSKDIDLVVLSSLFTAPIHTSEQTKKNVSIFALTSLYKLLVFVRKIWGIFTYYAPQFRFVGKTLYDFSLQTIGKYAMNKEKSFISKFLNIPLRKIINFEHHETHAAAAYYASPFSNKKALVLTLDAEGDKLCSTVNIFDKGKMKRIASTSRERSIGWIYLYVTKYLGMKPMEHEYKVMGLAPYAKEKDILQVYEKIKNIITLDPKNPLTFTTKFNTQDTLYYLEKEMKGFRFDNIAGAFQKLVEERLIEWTKASVKKTKLSTVIFSGGVFMNVKANQKIAALPEVKNVFFMPSAGDESLPIGSCYLGYLHLKPQNQKYISTPIKSLYLGPSYSNIEIEEYLKKGNYFGKYKIKKFNNIEKEIARLLANNNVVGRMAGRMEWGARALGNRSLLANPKNPETIMIINEQMKDRDFWMPFAPSVLEEKMSRYCINKKYIQAPYMTISFDTTDLGEKDLKAAMHPYDFTIRPQAVSRVWNPEYYKIINEFEALTGIGAVLNTSFNLHGLPIVMGPKEAMYAFEHSGLQFIALENFLIGKN